MVSVTPSVQFARLTKRDASTEHEATARINSQMPLEVKVERADLVIDNDGSQEALTQRVASVAPRVRFSTEFRLFFDCFSTDFVCFDAAGASDAPTVALQRAAAICHAAAGLCRAVVSQIVVSTRQRLTDESGVSL